MNSRNPKSLLATYYRDTARSYEETHGQEEEHDTALRLIAGFAQVGGVRSILDVGTGTGRGVQTLSALLPDARVIGVDLSIDLLNQGVRAQRLTPRDVCVADGEQLPFADGSFDLCVETAVLHHVPNPVAVVREMLRVAKWGIAASDSNMYVDGTSQRIFPKGIFGSALKMWMCRCGLWKSLKILRTGKVWSYSEGDGVFWTYSVYESLPLLQKHCKQVFTIPLKGGARMHTLPVLGASHVLVVGIKTGAAEDVSEAHVVS